MLAITTDFKIEWVNELTLGRHIGAFTSRRALEILIQENPGAWAVKVWNQLPGVNPICTPKFRNRATAIDRIWAKVAELYPDAILPEDMPKKEGRPVVGREMMKLNREARKQRGGYAKKAKTQKAALASAKTGLYAKRTGRAGLAKRAHGLFTGVRRGKPGTPSKRDKVVQLLMRKDGATVPELCKRTGWKPAAVNGILQWILWVTTKGVKKLESQVNANGKRTYRAA